MFCLKAPTDEVWVHDALGHLDDVLIDHAHCEMKAASNAMSLATRHPSSLKLVRALVDLAREELDHYKRVIDFLERRGLSLTPPPVDEYAARLRRVPSRGDIPPLVDRLLVGALIEARSCERFKILIERLPKDQEPELHGFYEELFACEARHYRTFVDLAKDVANSKTRGNDGLVLERLEELSYHEATIVRALYQKDERATVHG